MAADTKLRLLVGLVILLAGPIQAGNQLSEYGTVQSSEYGTITKHASDTNVAESADFDISNVPGEFQGGTAENHAAWTPEYQSSVRARSRRAVDFQKIKTPHFHDPPEYGQGYTVPHKERVAPDHKSVTIQGTQQHTIGLKTAPLVQETTGTAPQPVNEDALQQHPQSTGVITQAQNVFPRQQPAPGVAHQNIVIDRQIPIQPHYIPAKSKYATTNSDKTKHQRKSRKHRKTTTTAPTTTQKYHRGKKTTQPIETSTPQTTTQPAGDRQSNVVSIKKMDQGSNTRQPQDAYVQSFYKTTNNLPGKPVGPASNRMQSQELNIMPKHIGLNHDKQSSNQPLGILNQLEGIASQTLETDNSQNQVLNKGLQHIRKGLKYLKQTSADSTNVLSKRPAHDAKQESINVEPYSIRKKQGHVLKNDAIGTTDHGKKKHKIAKGTATRKMSEPVARKNARAGSEKRMWSNLKGKPNTGTKNRVQANPRHKSKISKRKKTKLGETKRIKIGKRKRPKVGAGYKNGHKRVILAKPQMDDALKLKEISARSSLTLDDIESKKLVSALKEKAKQTIEAQNENQTSKAFTVDTDNIQDIAYGGARTLAVQHNQKRGKHTELNKNGDSTSPKNQMFINDERNPTKKKHHKLSHKERESHNKKSRNMPIKRKLNKGRRHRVVNERKQANGKRDKVPYESKATTQKHQSSSATPNLDNTRQLTMPEKDKEEPTWGEKTNDLNLKNDYLEKLVKEVENLGEPETNMKDKHRKQGNHKRHHKKSHSRKHYKPSNKEFKTESNQGQGQHKTSHTRKHYKHRNSQAQTKLNERQGQHKKSHKQSQHKTSRQQAPHTIHQKRKKSHKQAQQKTDHRHKIPVIYAANFKTTAENQVPVRQGYGTQSAEAPYDDREGANYGLRAQSQNVVNPANSIQSPYNRQHFETIEATFQPTITQPTTSNLGKTTKPSFTVLSHSTTHPTKDAKHEIESKKKEKKEKQKKKKQKKKKQKKKKKITTTQMPTSTVKTTTTKQIKRPHKKMQWPKMKWPKLKKVKTTLTPSSTSVATTDSQITSEPQSDLQQSLEQQSKQLYVLSNGADYSGLDSVIPEKFGNVQDTPNKQLHKQKNKHPTVTQHPISTQNRKIKSKGHKKSNPKTTKSQQQVHKKMSHKKQKHKRPKTSKLPAKKGKYHAKAMNWANKKIKRPKMKTIPTIVQPEDNHYTSKMSKRPKPTQFFDIAVDESTNKNEKHHSKKKTSVKSHKHKKIEKPGTDKKSKTDKHHEYHNKKGEPLNKYSTATLQPGQVHKEHEEEDTLTNNYGHVHQEPKEEDALFDGHGQIHIEPEEKYALFDGLENPLRGTNELPVLVHKGPNEERKMLRNLYKAKYRERHRKRPYGYTRGSRFGNRKHRKIQRQNNIGPGRIPAERLHRNKNFGLNQNLGQDQMYAPSNLNLGEKKYTNIGRGHNSNIAPMGQHIRRYPHGRKFKTNSNTRAHNQHQPNRKQAIESEKDKGLIDTLKEDIRSREKEIQHADTREGDVSNIVLVGLQSEAPPHSEQSHSTSVNRHQQWVHDWYLQRAIMNHQRMSCAVVVVFAIVLIVIILYSCKKWDDEWGKRNDDWNTRPDPVVNAKLDMLLAAKEDKLQKDTRSTDSESNTESNTETVAYHIECETVNDKSNKKIKKGKNMNTKHEKKYIREKYEDIPVHGKRTCTNSFSDLDAPKGKCCNNKHCVLNYWRTSKKKIPSDLHLGETVLNMRNDQLQMRATMEMELEKDNEGDVMPKRMTAYWNRTNDKENESSHAFDMKVNNNNNGGALPMVPSITQQLPAYTPPVLADVYTQVSNLSIEESRPKPKPPKPKRSASKNYTMEQIRNTPSYATVHTNSTPELKNKYDLCFPWINKAS